MPIDALAHLSAVIASDSVSALAEAINAVRLTAVDRDLNALIRGYLAEHPPTPWRTNVPPRTPNLSNWLRLLADTDTFSWAD